MHALIVHNLSGDAPHVTLKGSNLEQRLLEEHLAPHRGGAF